MSTTATTNLSETASRDPDLQRLLAKVERIGADTRRLDALPASGGLDLVLADARSLSGMIRYTSELAEHVSGKVRQLDCAKGRVTAGLQRVEDIIDLRACTDGVQKALQDEDFEIAAAHIHRYLTLDETVMRMTADTNEGSTLEASFEVLHKSEAVLKDIVQRQFDSAVQRNDRASIERFFKIFPLLNLHQAGLEKLGGYLGASLREQCEKARIAAGQDAAAQQLLQLFEALAASLEVHQPLVETFYGPGYLYGLLQVLQNEVDTQARRIIDRLRASRDLDNRVRLARAAAARYQQLQQQQQYQQQHQYQQQQHHQQQQQQQFDAKQLDSVLSELAVVSSRTELYLRFVTRRCLADWEAADSKGKSGGSGSGEAAGVAEDLHQQRLLRLEDFLGKCAVTRIVQKLVDEYCLLEEQFMREMLAKAVALDSSGGGGGGGGGSGPTDTRLADDAFFILKKCLRRAVSTGNTDATCAALNRASAVAEAQLVGALRQRLQRGFPSGWVQDAFGSKASVEESRQAYLAALNCAEACRGNLRDLRRLLEADTAEAAGKRRDRDKLVSCLQAMDASLGEALGSIAQAGVECLAESALRPQVKQILAPLPSVNHVITEDDLLAYEASDPWVEAACHRINQLADNFRQALLPPLFDALLQALATELVARMEKLLARKQFNRLGGLQLDREVRALAACLSGHASWSVRDKLARLSQTATVLGVESLDELLACWQDSVAAWRLTPTEVRQVLALRVDIRQDDVRKLRL